MDERARHDRTVRLLEARLEGLACASERSPGGDRSYEREIGAAATATRHAIALHLLDEDEATGIWAAAARRHPRSAWCRPGPRLAA